LPDSSFCRPIRGLAAPASPGPAQRLPAATAG